MDDVELDRGGLAVATSGYKPSWIEGAARAGDIGKDLN